jgi:Flp pilus assembly protein TadG
MRRYRGAALAEAAIIMSLLMMVTLGAIEYGWLFLKAQQITNAARQAARVAILPDADAPTRAAALLTILLGNAGLSDATVEWTWGAMIPGDTRQQVTVHVSVLTADHRIVNATFLPAPATIGCRVTMAREGT